MNQAVTLALYFFGGAVAGAIYLAILWVSVKSAVHKGGLWPIAAGVVLRLVLIVAVGYVVVAAKADGLAMLSLLAGFMIARFGGVSLARNRAPANGGPR